MPAYWDLDGVLLTTNQSVFAATGKIGDRPEVPRPGDEVIVAGVDRGMHSVLVHQVDPAIGVCRGETRGPIGATAGGKALEQGSLVQFSWKKIAGIHRGVGK